MEIIAGIKREGTTRWWGKWIKIFKITKYKPEQIQLKAKPTIRSLTHKNTDPRGYSATHLATQAPNKPRATRLLAHEAIQPPTRSLSYQPVHPLANQATQPPTRPATRPGVGNLHLQSRMRLFKDCFVTFSKDHHLVFTCIVALEIEGFCFYPCTKPTSHLLGHPLGHEVTRSFTYEATH